MQNNVFQKFPPQREEDLFELLQFVKEAPLAKDYWATLKSLYKQSEELCLHSPSPFLIKLLGALIIRLDQGDMKALQSPFPTQATLRYMKRRARRCLNQIAQNNPADYFKLASEILLAHEDKDKLDFSYQWISADIVLGNSRRCRQLNHGQGPYEFQFQNYHLHHLEEKHRPIWLDNIPFLHTLLSLKLPWEIHEFALKILENNPREIPELSDVTLVYFFLSPSNLLKRVAKYQASLQLSTLHIAPELFAGLWFYSSKQEKINLDRISPKLIKDNTQPSNKGIIQRLISNIFPSTNQPNAWEWHMGLALWKYTYQELLLGNNSQRVQVSISLLLDRYPQVFEESDLLTIAPALLQSPHNVLQELAFEAANKAPVEQAKAWLEALNMPQKPASQEDIDKYARISEIFYGKYDLKKVEIHDVENFIYHPHFTVAEFGWRIAEKVKRSSYSFYYVWSNLTKYPNSRGYKEIYFHNAISSAYGVKSFMKFHTDYSYLIYYVSDEVFLYIFTHGLDKIQEFIIKDFQKKFMESPFYYLNRLSLIPSPHRDKILEKALPKFAKQSAYYWHMNQAFHNIENDSWLQDALLQVIAHHRLNQREVEQLLGTILGYASIAKSYLNFFYQNQYYRPLFTRVFANTPRHIYQQPTLIPSEIRQEVLHLFDLDTILKITRVAGDDSFQVLAQDIYLILSDKMEQANFWTLVFGKIQKADEEEADIPQEKNNLRIRLIENDSFFKHFLNQKDTSILQINYPDMEAVLLTWLKNNEDLFPAGSSALMQVCTHKLPKLRTWGLTRAQTLGLANLFALQLMESDLPEPTELAQHYYQQLKIGSNQELEAILMLCDSPNESVRAFGIEFLENRKEKVGDIAQLLACLSEHADQRVQTLVAHSLEKQSIKESFVNRFDREILRTKNRSRLAKESIKARVEKELSLDPNTLLELARSQQKADAEWAIEQLTKMVLAGHKIEGFELD